MSRFEYKGTWYELDRVKVLSGTVNVVFYADLGVILVRIKFSQDKFPEFISPPALIIEISLEDAAHAFDALSAKEVSSP